MIEAIASYLPRSVLTNDELARQFPHKWTADTILEKTGIRQRHIAGEDETIVDMGFHACRRLSGKSDSFAPDFVLFCTQSQEHALASSACLLQHRLGLPESTGGLDIESGCSGYIYGLAVAAGLLKSGASKQLLFVTSEAYSQHIHHDNVACRTIFGDGATATLLTAESASELSAFAFGSDGEGQRHLAVPNQGDPGDWPFGAGCLHMNGPEVFSFTIARVPETVERILVSAQLDISDVDYFVFHQANAFMLEHLRKKLSIPQEKFVTFLENSGNTVSNTIPLALEQCIDQRQIEDGMVIMLLGFGVGLSWGGCILHWRAAKA